MTDEQKKLWAAKKAVFKAIADLPDDVPAPDSVAIEAVDGNLLATFKLGQNGYDMRQPLDELDGLSEIIHVATNHLDNEAIRATLPTKASIVDVIAVKMARTKSPEEMEAMRAMLARVNAG